MIVLVLLILSSAIYFGQAGVLDNERLLFSNPLKPRYVYFLTYGATALLGLAMLTGQFHPNRVLGLAGQRFCDKGFIPLMIMLGLLHLAWLPFSPDDPVTERMLVLRMNVVVMTICGQIILLAVTDMRGILAAIRLVAMGTCLLNVAIILRPELFSIRMGVNAARAAGLYWDPNECATFLAMILPLINAGRSRLTRNVQILVTLIGIFFTFSREGMVLWLLAVLLSEVIQPGVRDIPRSRLIRNSLGTAAVLLGLALVLAWLWPDIVETLRPYMNSDTYVRLQGGDEGSGSERVFLLGMGWEMFSTHPFFGAGYAATHVWTYSVSAHNMFILMLAEFGLVGLVWYLVFLWRVFSLPLGFGLVLGSLVAVESLFTHSWFDLYYYMLLIQLYWRYASLLAADEPAFKASP